MVVMVLGDGFGIASLVLVVGKTCLVSVEVGSGPWFWFLLVVGVVFGVDNALFRFVFGNRFGLMGLARVLVLGCFVIVVLLRPKYSNVMSWYFSSIFANSLQIFGFLGCFELCGQVG